MNQSQKCGRGVFSLLLNGLLATAIWGQLPLDPISAALDKDSDGSISAEELTQAVESLRGLDANKDGKLTLEEIMPRFPGGGPGFGRGWPRMEKRELVPEFDKDGDGRLNQEERKNARESLNDDSAGGPGGRRRGLRGGFGRGGGRDPATPGPRVTPEEAATFPDAGLYDSAVLRTLFLDFEQDDWQQEMADFKDSDVDVPATLTVDGKVYPNVGVHFRGMSSFMMVPEEYKRSLNVAVNFTDADQRLYGHRTLNLLNGNGDPSMMSSALYSHIASKFIPVPKANFVKVVLNGESWGVYVNSQQFNTDFVKEHFGTSKGARWKVRGNPGADGGLRYLGDELSEYKQRFQMKTKDKEEAWERLIELCRILEETPPDQLAGELESIIDVDELLWFLALDVALVNSDGYWTRASDYSLYLDKQDRFHVIPHDMNEAFHGAHESGPGGFRGPPGFGPPNGFGRPDGFGPPAGFGPPPGREVPPGVDEPNGDNEEGGVIVEQPRRPRGRGGFGPPNEGSIDLDPLVNDDNPRMPLRAKVLAVPRLRQQYLRNVRTIAEQMSWEKVGPVVRQLRELIEAEIQADTKKLSTFDAFVEATRDESADSGLRHFLEGRRKYLLEHEEISALPVGSPDELVINEVMANNKSKDGDGRLDDWIELLNPSDHEVDLSGVSLSDDAKQLHKWTFPSGTKIAPGALVLVWADKDENSTDGFHAGFKLGKKGESIYVTRRTGKDDTMLDSLRYGRNDPGMSLGRAVPGSSVCVPMEPTPGEPNRVIE
jgi:Ca2+-binding EF-hand superfamily protein